jgi:GTP pyrophosphokinase
LLEHERATREPAAPVQAVPAARKPRAGREGEFTVEGVGNLLVQIARCCQPLPGEPIAGYLTRARGVSVHRPDCAGFQRLAAADPQRVLPVEWRRGGSAYDVSVELVGIDRKWLLKEVTNVVAQAGVALTGMNTEHARGGTQVTLQLRLRVADYGQLSSVLGKLAALPGVEHARRA